MPWGGGEGGKGLWGEWSRGLVDYGGGLVRIVDALECHAQAVLRCFRLVRSARGREGGVFSGCESHTPRHTGWWVVHKAFSPPSQKKVRL